MLPGIKRMELEVATQAPSGALAYNDKVTVNIKLIK
jgi:hypothetical protein